MNRHIKNRHLNIRNLRSNIINRHLHIINHRSHDFSALNVKPYTTPCIFTLNICRVCYMRDSMRRKKFFRPWYIEWWQLMVVNMHFTCTILSLHYTKHTLYYNMRYIIICYVTPDYILSLHYTKHALYYNMLRYT